MTPQAEQQVTDFQQRFGVVRQEIGKIIVGNHEVVEGILICLLAGGHALPEGIPGLGKTKLVHALADVRHLDVHRIQLTHDPKEPFWNERGNPSMRKSNIMVAMRCRRWTAVPLTMETGSSTCVFIRTLQSPLSHRDA